jgi:hypothetical protein
MVAKKRGFSSLSGYRIEKLALAVAYVRENGN